MVEENAPEAKWYVVHTYSGYENKVKATLERIVENRGIHDFIQDISVPMEEQIEIKDGKKKTIQRKIYPGYVLVKMEMTDEAWHIVKNVPRVTGFVGPAKSPSTVSEEEVQHLLKQIETGAEKPKPKVLFEKDEKVKIIDGPFASFIGQVEEVNIERCKLKVMVSIFGRSTPVELNFLQVEKL